MKHGLIIVKAPVLRRQAYGHRRPAARLAGHPDRRAVPVGYPLDEAEPQTGPFGARGSRRIAPKKTLEHVRHGPGRDPDPGIPHFQDRLRSVPPDLHADAPAGGRELDGIVEEVQEEALQPAGIAEDQHRPRHLYRQAAPLRLGYRLELFDEGRRQQGEVHGPTR